jgi:hypothetical protein
LVVSLTDQNTGNPIGLVGSTVRLKFRVAGGTTVKDILIGSLIPGLVNADGSITTTSPYDQPGTGGRVVFSWNPTTLDTSGNFEGEIEVTFSDSSVQTAYSLLKFQVRSQF